MSRRLSLEDQFEVVDIKRSTKAKMLENVEIGDILKFEVELKPAGMNRGTYATYISITNLRTKESTSKSFNQLTDVFSILEFK